MSRWWQTEHFTLDDGAIVDVRWWDRVTTHRRISPIVLWWYYNVLRYPKPPPFAKDRIAQHFGFVDGIPACKGPICEAHEWKVP